MKKHKFITFSLFFSILLIACGSEIKKEKSVLTGKVTGTTTSELYLIDLLNPKSGPVDTAVIAEDGAFSFDYQPKMKGFYRVTFSENFSLILPLSKNQTSIIEGDVNNLDQLEIKGNEDAIRMKKMNEILKENFLKSKALEEGFQQYANAPKRDSILNEFRKKYSELENSKANELKKMIDADVSSFTNLAIIEQMPKDETEYYLKVDKAIASKYGESPYYKNFHARVLDISRFAVGSDVPEINLPDPNGNLVALSSLRGQVVLIDFWASWCRPCRQENPNVVAAYKKYKDKGFTVFGVSLDKTKAAWTNAITQDNLTWTQVSDLKFWQSEAARAYGVSSIPFALLIDADGKVIGKNLRGAALQQKLAEVLD